MSIYDQVTGLQDSLDTMHRDLEETAVMPADHPALVNENHLGEIADNTKQHRESTERIIEELKRQADAAEKSAEISEKRAEIATMAAELAEKQAEDSNLAAEKSERFALWSLLCAIVATIVAIVQAFS